MNMKNLENFYDPIDKYIRKGVIDSTFLKILAKTNLLSTWRNEFLELDKIYKWPNVKQTYYKVLIEVDNPTVVSNGKMKHYKNIIYTKKIRIIRKGGNKNSEERLESYLNEK